MSGFDLVVDRRDLTRAEIRPLDTDAALAEGEALFEIERFALTANNITYGAVGDQIGYWRFFPAPEGLGRIPVWGFARVVRSHAAEAPEGLRLFGYWPMSSHAVARMARRGAGYVETSAHRAELPPTYNAYSVAEPSDQDDVRALLRPLFMTGFILDDQICETPPASLVLSSASSKTALSLAWLARRRGVKVIGLTSAAHVERLGALNLYDELAPYEAAGQVSASAPAVYVDFAGRRAITAHVHAALGADLVASIGVGVTHWDALGAPRVEVPGPAPSFFFAPDRIRQRMKDWGAEGLDQRFGEAMAAFVADSPWLTLRHHQGADALLALYGRVVAGAVQPDDGHIVLPA